MRLFPAWDEPGAGESSSSQPETTVTPSSSDDIVVGRSSIDITQPQQIVFWTEQLGVSEMQLRYAVAEAGESLGDIRDYLGVKQ
jgi:hypothetical protein